MKIMIKPLSVKYGRGKNPNSRNGWKKGENFTGMLGKKHSEKTKDKLSEINKGKEGYWLGKERPDIARNMRERVVSDLTKKRMSENSKGKKMPPRTKEHLDNLKKSAENNPNFGMRNKKHSKQWKINMSNRLVGKMPENIMVPGKYGNVKRGYFNINGKEMFFRSMWEANYALYLDFLIKQKEIVRWEFEKDVFIFDKIKFGTRSYKPDFKVYTSEKEFEYHEVKGWMDSKSKTKLNRMRIYYPKIKMVLIDAPAYKDIKNKIGRLIGFFE